MPILSRQLRQRRSLLARPLQMSGDVPLWKSLVIAYAILLLLAMAWHLIADAELRLQSIGITALFSILFGTPITILAHYSTMLVRRYGAMLSKSRRVLVMLVAWLLSGAVGSMIGYGALELFGGVHSSFGTSWLMPLVIGSAFTALVIGTFILFFKAVEERLRRRQEFIGQEELLTAEFQAARSVQQSLLPNEDVKIHGFDISGATAPAVEIGGDYYDYLSFADGMKGVLVADAAGKGIPAALVMAKFQGMAQALSIHVASPAEFFVGLNDTLRVRLDRHSFITVGMLTIDFEDRCTFYRAGHNPLLLYRAATHTVESLRPGGIALGLTHGAMLGSSLQEMSFEMTSGDVALIYSDGLSEAVNRAGHEYGEPRVIESLRAAAREGRNAVDIRSLMLNHLSIFVGEAEPHDDITVVVVRKS